MKNTVALVVLAILFSSCYDNFRLGEDELEPPTEEPTGVGATTDDGDTDNDTDTDTDNGSETEVAEPGYVYFADVVWDEEGQPISGVTVSIFANDIRYAQVTKADGTYRLAVPHENLPQVGYISISLTREKYIPYNLTYAMPLDDGAVYGSEDILALSPCSTCLVIGDKSSELFHLGDDLFGGPENSQFQKASDGLEVEYEIDGSMQYSQLKMGLDIKGLQSDLFEEGQKSSIEFYSRGELVAETRLVEESPENGSYSTFEFVLDNSQPITSLKVITRNFGPVDSNYDDWEFTCMYLEGR